MRNLFNIEPPLLLASIIIIVASICFMYGGLTENVSQVDRLWSILPVIVCWMYYYISEYSSIVLLMTLCVTLWGLRLTANFYIKGGYRFEHGVFTDEDYRWGYMRTVITNSICWDLFHLLFICFFQISLIVGFTVPILLVAISDSNNKPILIEDYCFLAVFLFYFGIEAIADKCMLSFQTKKYSLTSEERLQSLDPRIVAGFNFTGLFKYSRHPNYFAEVMQWVVIYLWGSYRIGNFLNWGLLFAVILCILVFASTFISEPISSSKYKFYCEYQKVTSRFIPMIPIRYNRFVDMIIKKQE